MKALVLISTILAAAPTFAHVSYNALFDMVNDITILEGTHGHYSKNGQNVGGRKDCFMELNDIDSWSSEGTITADLLSINVGSFSLGTDLETWDLKTEKVQTDGSLKYTQEFLGTNKCQYKNELVVRKGKSLTLTEAKVCRNGVKTRETVSCGI
jgi:hypothetical protein